MQQNYTAEFTNEFNLSSTVSAVRAAGFDIVDAYTPYAVHGLDALMGLKKSRLSRTCFMFAFLGLTIGVLGQYWVSAVNWPINIGGRPWNSLPAFMPVAFEVTVLFAGLGTVFTFFMWKKIKFGRPSLQPSLRATNDRFYLVMKQGDKPNPSSILEDIVLRNNGKMLEN